MDVLSYDVTSNTLTIGSYLDVSNGMLMLSQSQKASIVEGVGQDIDIGVYDMKVNNVISSSLESSKDGGMLYTNRDGKILSMKDVLSYDVTSNTLTISINKYVGCIKWYVDVKSKSKSINRRRCWSRY